MAIPVFVHHSYEFPDRVRNELASRKISIDEAIREEIERRCDLFKEAEINVSGYPCFCMYSERDLPKLPPVVICHPFFTHIEFERQDKCFGTLKRVIDSNPKTTFYILNFHTPGASNRSKLQEALDLSGSDEDIDRIKLVAGYNLPEMLEEIKESK